jgi:hypothetical protein
VSSAFSGFVCVLTYLLWWHIGMLLTRVTTLPNRWKHLFGYPREKPLSATSATEARDAH